MKEKFFQEDSSTLKTEEDGSFNFSIIRPDSSLFKEEEYVPQILLRVKYSFKKKEAWEFWKNNEKVAGLSARKFSESERKFLRSVQGSAFLLSQFKKNEIKFSQIKKLIKNG